MADTNPQHLYTPEALEACEKALRTSDQNRTSKHHKIVELFAGMREFRSDSGAQATSVLNDVGLRKHVDNCDHLITHYFRIVRSVCPAFFVMKKITGSVARAGPSH